MDCVILVCPAAKQVWKSFFLISRRALDKQGRGCRACRYVYQCDEVEVVTATAPGAALLVDPSGCGSVCAVPL